MGCGCGAKNASPQQTAPDAPNPNADGAQPRVEDAWWQATPAQPAVPMPA